MDQTILANLTSQITESTNRINNEVTNQASLIGLIQSALEGKAGGSGGTSAPDICSFSVGTVAGTPNFTVYYTTYESGAITSKTQSITANTNISNVLCNSLIVLVSSTALSTSAAVSGVSKLTASADKLYYIFKVTASANGSGTLYMM